MGILLEYTPERLKHAFKKPKQIVILLLIAYIIVPILPKVVVSFFTLPSAILAGYVLTAMAPVAIGTIVWSNLLKGDASVAIAFVGLTLLLTPVVVPALSLLLLSTYVTVDPLYMIKLLAGTVSIPFAIALLTKKVVNLSKHSTKLVLLLLFVILAAIISLNAENLTNVTYIVPLTLLAFFHCAVNFFFSWTVSQKWSYEERLPFVFGITIRNMAIIITIAVVNFGAMAALPGSILIIVQQIVIAGSLFFTRKK